MPLCQGIPVLSLRQESPFLLCGLQGCGKISLLTAVTVRVRGVPFYPFNTDGKRKKRKCGERYLWAAWFRASWDWKHTLFLPSALCFCWWECWPTVHFTKGWSPVLSPEKSLNVSSINTALASCSCVSPLLISCGSQFLFTGYANDVETILFLDEGDLRNLASILTHSTLDNNTYPWGACCLMGRTGYMDTVVMQEKLWAFGRLGTSKGRCWAGCWVQSVRI